MKRTKKFLSLMLILIMCFSVMPMTELGIEAEAANETTLSAMRERAEAIINYKWIPSQNITTWNNNTYNGRKYFKKGETVTGMPYTLFTTEVVSHITAIHKFSAKNFANKVSTTRTINRAGSV